MIESGSVKVIINQVTCNGHIGLAPILTFVRKIVNSIAGPDLFNYLPREPDVKTFHEFGMDMPNTRDFS